LRQINIGDLKSDIIGSHLIENPASDINSHVAQYNQVLSGLIDRHAPLITKSITLRPHAPWYSDELREQKRVKRQCERKWVASGLEVYKQIYHDECKRYKDLLEKSKTAYHKSQVDECDQGKLFQLIDSFVSSANKKVLPTHESSEDLACQFSEFFNDKIKRVKVELDNISCGDSITAQDHKADVPCFSVFDVMSQDSVRKIIMNSKSTSCPLDPIPTWLVKKCISELLPTICDIVNDSLTCGTVPRVFKEARLSPLIKKSSLDPECLKNYRPVSNLSFISKIVERCVAKQLTEHLDINDLHGRKQSAYRKNHSTETAIIRVTNDLLRAVDRHGEVVLVLLDLTAAFDTINHEILLQRLCNRYGMDGTVLRWFQSYLFNRAQTVTIDGAQSDLVPLCDGVPQGSVLGPLCFSMYTAPLEDLINSHDGVELMVYADDTQLYMVFNPSESSTAITKLELCIKDVNNWMTVNKLKLNGSKTEILHLSSKFSRKSIPIDHLQIDSDSVQAVSSARNLGVTFDNQLCMSTHVNNVCRAANFALRKIGQVRKFLDQGSAERLVHAFVSSRLDCCNSILYGLPDYEIAKLQHVQNTAARLVACVRKREHITPILHQLHWLPVRKRIEFKILLITYKALNGLAPDYISDLISVHKPSRSLRSGAKYLLSPIKTSTVYGSRSFAAAAPTLWNELPMHIKCAVSVDIFKSSLKTYLFTL
jgi:hypothetical protein